MSTAFVGLNMVHSEHAESSGHCGCSPGQSGHFGGSYAMITQSLENSKKSAFGRISQHEGMVCQSGVEVR
jgi:hypothetical protein